MHLVMQKFFTKNITCTSNCVVPSLCNMKPNWCCSPHARGCVWKARAGAEGRRGTGASHGQCFCADGLKHPRLKCNLEKAGVIFFEGGTSTHLLHADGRALPQEDSEFVEGVREVHYRSKVLQSPRQLIGHNCVLSTLRFGRQRHRSSC